jgi:hypothetical protein
MPLLPALMKENKTLEHWRRHYLTEALFCGLLAGGGIALVLWLAEYIWLRLSLTLSILGLLYLMIKELHADLQTRGQALVLAHAGELFPTLRFDYAKGIAEDSLSALQSVPRYTRREIGNVLHTPHGQIEEEWLYTTMVIRHITFPQTAFKGLVLRLPKPSSLPAGKTAVLDLRHAHAPLSGELAASLNRLGVNKELATLLHLFDEQTLTLESSTDALYIFLKTEKPLFHPFSLTTSNTSARFTERITRLAGLCETLYTLLQG